MKQILLYGLTLILFIGCRKENGAKVDIYLLNSFTLNIDQSTSPATTSITNAVLENTPLVANQDIKLYTRATTTFTLKKDIQKMLENYGSDKAFAVTVNNQPVYYGLFHPTYLSSMIFGVATIMPIKLNNKELKINFITIDGNAFLQQLDKRNDNQIINALKETNKLR